MVFEVWGARANVSCSLEWNRAVFHQFKLAVINWSWLVYIDFNYEYFIF